MTKYYLYTIHFFILITTHFHIGAQDQIFDIKIIGLDEGLTSRYVNSINKDNNGYLWINSKTGYNRFDGYQVKTYRYNVNESENIFYERSIKSSDGLIWNIYYNASKRKFNLPDSLIIQAYQLGFKKLILEIFDPIKNTFIKFEDFISPHNLNVTSSDILDIYSFSKGVVMVLKDRLIIYDGKFRSSTLPIFLKNKVFSSSISSTGHMVFLTTSAFYIYDEKWKLIRSELLDTSIQGRAILINDDNHIWILTKNKNSKKEEIFYLKGINEKLKNLNIKDFNPTLFQRLLEYQSLDNDHGLLRINGEIYRHHKYKNTYTRIDAFIPSIDFKKISFREMLIIGKTIYLSSSNGVFIIKSKTKKFKSYFNNDDRLTGMRGITSINGKVIANSYSGIRYIDDFEKHIIDDLSIYLSGVPIYFDKYDNAIWKGHHGPQVYKKPIDKIDSLLEISIPVKGIEVYTIQRCHYNQTIYLGTSMGLYFITDDDKVEKISSTNSTFNQPLIKINHIQEYKNSLWLATSFGLFQYDLNTKKVNSFKAKDTNLLNSNFAHLHIASDSTFWLASTREGLLKWNREKNEIKQYSKQNGLSNDRVHAIISDSLNLWISTNFGLNKLNKKTETLISYYEGDGISNNEFNKLSYHKTNDGKIYFGGINGMTEILPYKINELENDTINIASVEVEIKNSENEISIINYKQNQTITFNPTDKNIKLKIIPSSLHQSTKNKYYYKIDHLGDNWQSTNQNEINFANLPYGQLTIDIKIETVGIDNSSLPYSISIYSDKPYYYKFPFSFFCFSFLLAFVLLTVKLRNDYFRRKQEKLEKIIEERTFELKEINETKRKLFSMLAHDLRNPIASLTNITRKIQYLITNDQPELLDKLTVQVDNKLHNLNRNLDNILNWALSEKSSIPYYPQKLIIHDQCVSILSLYSEFIIQKNLSYNISCNHEQSIYADETGIQTILRNLIHNAIKFSERDEIIEIDVIEVDSHTASISIINKLAALDTAAKNNKKGMGLGLNIVRDLALINKGEFSYHIDENNQSFKATINLPSHKSFDK